MCADARRAGQVDVVARPRPARDASGKLVRRIRAEPGPPVHILAVLSRLDREGPAGRQRPRRTRRRCGPQSMAQTVKERAAGRGLGRRAPTPRRRVVARTLGLRLPPPGPGRRAPRVRRADRRGQGAAEGHARRARGLAGPGAQRRARRGPSASRSAPRWRCWRASPRARHLSGSRDSARRVRTAKVRLTMSSPRPRLRPPDMSTSAPMSSRTGRRPDEP